MALDYLIILLYLLFTTCHALQHWSVAWWDGFRLPHYSTVALLHLYATPYSTRLLPDEMALALYSSIALLHLYATPYSTGLLPDEMALDYLIILL